MCCCHFRALCTLPTVPPSPSSPSPWGLCPDRETEEALPVDCYDLGVRLCLCTGSSWRLRPSPTPDWAKAGQVSLWVFHRECHLSALARPILKPRPLSKCQLQSRSSTLFSSLLPSCLQLCRLHWMGPSAPISINDDLFAGHNSIPKSPPSGP